LTYGHSRKGKLQRGRQGPLETREGLRGRALGRFWGVRLPGSSKIVASRKKNKPEKKGHNKG